MKILKSATPPICRFFSGFWAPKIAQKCPKTTQKPPYWQFGAFPNFYDTYFDYQQVLCVEITEKTKNHKKHPKNAQKPPKTAQKPPFWRFGGFSNFQNPFFAKLASFVSKFFLKNEKLQELCKFGFLIICGSAGPQSQSNWALKTKNGHSIF